MVVCGTGAAVAVLVSMLSLAEGLLRTINSAARTDRVIVLAKGAVFEGASQLTRAQVNDIRSAAQAEGRRDDGQSVSGEVLAYVRLRSADTSSESYVVVRGVPPHVLEVRPEIRIVAGRLMRPGMRELVVGRAARDSYAGLEIGEAVMLRGTPWSVVGVFESDRNLRESEILGDAESILSFYQRSQLNSVVIKFSDPQQQSKFKATLQDIPSLNVEAVDEHAYARRQTGVFASILLIVAYIVGGLMAIAALFASLNSMFLAISQRTSELATLRAIGFAPASIVISVLAEAILLAAAGALVGIVCVLVLLEGRTFASNGALSQLHLTSDLIATGLAWAFAMGLVGGAFPAFRAMRVSIAAALKEP